MRGVLVRWPLGISLSLVKALSDVATVYCLVSPMAQQSARLELESGGVLDYELIVAGTDSYWTRDYGPWWVETDHGLAVVDHEYNRPRPQDNAVPAVVADALGVPYFNSGLVGTGGNLMVDGLGQGSASHIAYTENSACGTVDEASIPLPPCESVDRVMRESYGVQVLHVLADPNDDYIDHIDCWAKYLSPTVVLVRRVPADHPQYSMVEQVASYLGAVNTSSGGAWTVVRVDTPTDQPYSNALILNNHVFVPVVGSAWDDAALDVYRAAMPGHIVTGWTGSWQPTDALHCRIRGIPAAAQQPGSPPPAVPAPAPPAMARPPGAPPPPGVPPDPPTSPPKPPAIPPPEAPADGGPGGRSCA
jgi:agmatine/peptidylarginine deiminase